VDECGALQAPSKGQALRPMDEPGFYTADCDGNDAIA